jgi:endonuclease/exonuclease/phosphatase (EEP) superfamily protein YafD
MASRSARGIEEKDARVTWPRRALQVLAVAYPLSLIAVAATLRYIGEGWWVSNVGLYVPRIVFGAPLPFLATALLVLRMRRLLWAQAVSAAVVLFSLMGFVLPWPTFARPAAGRLRVLSFNVNGGYGGAEAVVDAVDPYAPDIVLFQETAGLDEFSRLLRLRYPTVEAVDQFVLATRFPLSSTLVPNKLAYNGRERNPRFLRYALETPLGPVVVYNVHPISPREGLYGLRGPLGLRHEIVTGGLLRGDGASLLWTNAGLRTLQVQTFSRAIADETGSVIIAGDTNLPGLSPVFHRYLSTYNDGFTHASWGFGYTFPTNKWRPWMRIDRILANDAFRFVHFEVGHDTVSDHRCVVADLERREP